MNYFWILGFVCLSFAVVQSQTDLFEVPKRSLRKTLCGRNLAEALAVVCDGWYNRYLVKKDMSYNELLGEEYVYDQQSEEAEWPLLARQNANALLTRNDVYGRHRRGVADECCKKSCTTAELQKYCGPRLL